MARFLDNEPFRYNEGSWQYVEKTTGVLVTAYASAPYGDETHQFSVILKSLERLFTNDSTPRQLYLKVLPLPKGSARPTVEEINNSALCGMQRLTAPDGWLQASWSMPAGSYVEYDIYGVIVEWDKTVAATPVFKITSPQVCITHLVSADIGIDTAMIKIYTEKACKIKYTLSRNYSLLGSDVYNETDPDEGVLYFTQDLVQGENLLQGVASQILYPNQFYRLNMVCLDENSDADKGYQYSGPLLGTLYDFRTRPIPPKILNIGVKDVIEQYATISATVSKAGTIYSTVRIGTKDESVTAESIITYLDSKISYTYVYSADLDHPIEYAKFNNYRYSDYDDYVSDLDISGVAYVPLSSREEINGGYYMKPNTVYTAYVVLKCYSGLVSEVATFEFKTADIAEPPVPSISGGTYFGSQNVKFSAPEGFIPYYTDKILYYKYPKDNPPSVLDYKSGFTEYNPESDGLYIGEGDTVLRAKYLYHPHLTISNMHFNGCAYSKELVMDFKVFQETSNPEADIPSGAYYDRIDVNLTCYTENSSIWYTVDGTTPSATNGKLYADSLTITSDTVLKAVAYNPSSRDYSDVVTFTYKILQVGIDNYIPAVITASNPTAVLVNNCIDLQNKPFSMTLEKYGDFFHDGKFNYSDVYLQWYGRNLILFLNFTSIYDIEVLCALSDVTTESVESLKGKWYHGYTIQSGDNCIVFKNVPRESKYLYLLMKRSSKVALILIDLNDDFVTANTISNGNVHVGVNNKKYNDVISSLVTANFGYGYRVVGVTKDSEFIYKGNEGDTCKMGVATIRKLNKVTLYQSTIYKLVLNMFTCLDYSSNLSTYMYSTPFTNKNAFKISLFLNDLTPIGTFIYEYGTVSSGFTLDDGSMGVYLDKDKYDAVLKGNMIKYKVEPISDGKYQDMGVFESEYLDSDVYSAVATSKYVNIGLASKKSLYTSVEVYEPITDSNGVVTLNPLTVDLADVITLTYGLDNGTSLVNTFNGGVYYNPNVVMSRGLLKVSFTMKSGYYLKSTNHENFAESYNYEEIGADYISLRIDQDFTLKFVVYKGTAPVVSGGGSGSSGSGGVDVVMSLLEEWMKSTDLSSECSLLSFTATLSATEYIPSPIAIGTYGHYINNGLVGVDSSQAKEFVLTMDGTSIQNGATTDPIKLGVQCFKQSLDKLTYSNIGVFDLKAINSVMDANEYVLSFSVSNINLRFEDSFDIIILTNKAVIHLYKTDSLSDFVVESRKLYSSITINGIRHYSVDVAGVVLSEAVRAFSCPVSLEESAYRCLNYFMVFVKDVTTGGTLLIQLRYYVTNSSVEVTCKVVDAYPSTDIGVFKNSHIYYDTTGIYVDFGMQVRGYSIYPNSSAMTPYMVVQTHTLTESSTESGGSTTVLEHVILVESAGSAYDYMYPAIVSTQPPNTCDNIYALTNGCGLGLEGYKYSRSDAYDGVFPLYNGSIIIDKKRSIQDMYTFLTSFYYSNGSKPLRCNAHLGTMKKETVQGSYPGSTVYPAVYNIIELGKDSKSYQVLLGLLSMEPKSSVFTAFNSSQPNISGFENVLTITPMFQTTKYVQQAINEYSSDVHNNTLLATCVDAIDSRKKGAYIYPKVEIHRDSTVVRIGDTVTFIVLK